MFDPTEGCPECGGERHVINCTRPYRAAVTDLYPQLRDIAELEASEVDGYEISAEAADGSTLDMRPTGDPEGLEGPPPYWHLYISIYDPKENASTDVDVDHVVTARAVSRFRAVLDEMNRQTEASDHAMGVCMPEHCHIHKQEESR